MIRDQDQSRDELLAELATLRAQLAACEGRTDATARDERLTLALNSAKMGWWDCDLVNGVTEGDDYSKALFGLSREDIPTVEEAVALIHAEDRGAVQAELARALAASGEYEIEFRITKPDGGVRWLSAKGRSYVDPVAGPQRLMGVVSDISARKTAEAAVAEDRNLLRTLIDTLPDLVFVKDTEARVTLCNATAERYLGVAEAAMCGKTAFDVNPPELARGYHTDDQHVLTTGKTCEREELIRRRTGEDRWHATTKTPLRNAQGGITGLLVVCRDIHDQKAAEAALRDSERRVRATLEAILAPNGDIGALELSDIVDAPAVQSLMDEFHHLTGVPMALIDIEGRVLVGVGWQEICTRFHRCHPMTAEHCRASDTLLSRGIPPGESRLYKCENNMWDVATPITIGGRQFGNIFSGQFFFTDEAIDYELFAQAHRYDFDEEEYLDALDAVPRIDRHKIDIAMSFFAKLADVLSQLGYNNLRLARTLVHRQQAEEALTKAKAAAEAANMAKSQFLANMSHELRTPMSAILGMTELALEEELAPTVRDLLQTARESADALLELLNEILDLSRIEAGGMQFESRAFSLAALLDKTLKTFGVRAHEKSILLTRDIAADVPDCLIGDALRLRQIITNLLGNSLKFTSKGRIVVRAALVEQRNEHVCLQFSVTDTGIGISAENRERIFAPFTQADASTTRRYGGTGLGLTICRRLVELMDGRIWVESELGFGSTFYFTVWLGRGVATDAAESTAATQARFAGAPVLVIDDQEPSRRAVQDMLAGWSLRPEAAADVPMALTKMHEAAAGGAPFHLVIANAYMPGIDGFALARWVRDEPRLAGRVALVMPPLTPAAAKRCEELHAFCLEKPVSQAELLEVVTRAILGPPAEPAAATDEATDQPSVQPLRILLAEDTPANRKLVARILEKRGHQVTAVANGQEAVARVCDDEFDVVLMDVQMPGLDGFEATAVIRKLPDARKARVPIVAMTAHALKGDRERCLEAGMDAYVAKPIHAAELFETVERAAR